MSGGTGGTMTSRRAQIAWMRRVAMPALEPLRVAGRPADVPRRTGSNTTVRHDSGAGREDLRPGGPTHRRGLGRRARRRRSARRSPGSAIRAGTDLLVSRGTSGATRRPPTVEAIPAGWIPGSARCSAGWTAASWRGPARPVHLRRLGGAMARLHTTRPTRGRRPPTSSASGGTARRSSVTATVYGETPAAGCWGAPPAGRERARFEGGGRPDEREPRRRRTTPRLIHADLHLGNALFHRGRRPG